MSAPPAPGAGLIVPTFTLSLGQSVLPGCVCAGRLEDAATGAVSLACATTGGRVFVHGGGGGGGGSGGGGGGGSVGGAAAGYGAAADEDEEEEEEADRVEDAGRRATASEVTWRLMFRKRTPSCAAPAAAP